MPILFIGHSILVKMTTDIGEGASLLSRPHRNIPPVDYKKLHEGLVSDVEVDKESLQTTAQVPEDLPVLPRDGEESASFSTAGNNLDLDGSN